MRFESSFPNFRQSNQIVDLFVRNISQKHAVIESSEHTHTILSTKRKKRSTKGGGGGDEVGFNARPMDRYVGRACTQVLFLRKPELGFFHILERAQQDGWLPSAGQKIPVQPCHQTSTAQDPALTEKRFLQTDFS
jgi:hypothetical protein